MDTVAKGLQSCSLELALDLKAGAGQKPEVEGAVAGRAARLRNVSVRSTGSMSKQN
ncbi:hypothetical protein PQR64_32600 [Paraburkholderia phytofirmans]|uniref:hypothetical protein n=1 Tax=Paraburkholderia phytofirmans TaxID=261302 RepID=UPI0038BCB07F